MPQKRNNNKKGKRDGKRNKGQMALLPRVTTMPNTKRILMTFPVSASLVESAAGTGVSFFYRLNSVYDPNATGGGSACGGYNTWSALFLNYKVHRVTARVQGTAVVASGSYAVVIIAPVASQAVVPTNPEYWKLIPGAKTYTVVPNANGGRSTFQHTMAYDNASIARLTKQQYAIDMDFSGTIGSNPARMNYLMLGAVSVNSGTPATVPYSIQITYEVEWFNPIPMQA